MPLASLPLASAPRSSKEDLRDQCRAYRTALSAEHHLALSTEIVAHALTLAELQEARTVHCYWPLLARREVDTRALLQALWDRGASVVLPVVTRFGAADGTDRLIHRQCFGPADLVPNRWGVYEPQAGPLVPPSALDAVVVPALGADPYGARLGYGFGYYDEFLQATSCPRIGLLYASCVLPRVPTDPHDVPLTHLVTEDGTSRCLPAYHPANAST